MLAPDEQAAANSGELKPNDVTGMNPSWAWAAGGAISTADDLARYVKALVGGGLLTKRSQQQRLDSIQPTDPENPASTLYGYAAIGSRLRTTSSNAATIKNSPPMTAGKTIGPYLDSRTDWLPRGRPRPPVPASGCRPRRRTPSSGGSLPSAGP